MILGKLLARTGIWKNVICHDTFLDLFVSSERMPHGDQSSTSKHPLPERYIEKNGALRLAIYRAEASGAMTKGELNLDGGVGAARTLLIDSDVKNIAAWQAIGGWGYHHPRPGVGLE
tara:strand:+ start:168 stop:518 length:351 start_codon:yes stop_codon:yes gene_type:complete